MENNNKLVGKFGRELVQYLSQEPPEYAENTKDMIRLETGEFCECADCLCQVGDGLCVCI